MSTRSSTDSFVHHTSRKAHHEAKIFLTLGEVIPRHEEARPTMRLQRAIAWWKYRNASRAESDGEDVEIQFIEPILRVDLISLPRKNGVAGVPEKLPLLSETWMHVADRRRGKREKIEMAKGVVGGEEEEQEGECQPRHPLSSTPSAAPHGADRTTPSTRCHDPIRHQCGFAEES